MSEIVLELREQIEEATDPKDPAKLREYTKSLREGIKSLIPMLDSDPVLGAMAFHGQIKVVNSVSVQAILDREDRHADRDLNWSMVKGAIRVRPEAHEAITVLERAGCEEVLVTIVVANFALGLRKKKLAEREEEKEVFDEL